MNQVAEYLPFKPTIGGFVGMLVTVAAMVYVAKKIPVLNKLV